MTSHPPALVLADWLGPVFGAFVFIALVGLILEPRRHRCNAVFFAGACGVYMSGGFGVWELLFVAVASVVAYQGLSSYRWIGVGWLLHASWDIAHHFYGHPIWPFMPTSSFGCLLFDAVIAGWFLAGAPSLRYWIMPAERNQAKVSASVSESGRGV